MSTHHGSGCAEYHGAIFCFVGHVGGVEIAMDRHSTDSAVGVGRQWFVNSILGYCDVAVWPGLLLDVMSVGYSSGFSGTNTSMGAQEKIEERLSLPYSA